MIHRSIVCALLLLACAHRPVAAQQDSSRSADKQLFHRRDLMVGGGFAALTVAMFPLDRRLAVRLQDSSTQASQFLRTATRRVQYLGDPGSVIFSAALFGVGRVSGWRGGADVGLHSMEAIALSGVLTGTLKAVTGRARPYASAGEDPDHFTFFGGVSNGRFQSFPSGHTTAAFAVASTVTSESFRRWPRGAWLIAPALYGAATAVGLSRMYNNAHWASDVALGAGIGTFAGLKVVRFAHTHPDNPFDRALLGMRASALPHRGLLLSWSVTR